MLRRTLWFLLVVVTRFVVGEIEMFYRHPHTNEGRPTQHIDELQRKLESVRREVRNLTVMGMDTKQPADRLAMIKQLEISARAEQRLRKKALDYARTKS